MRYRSSPFRAKVKRSAAESKARCRDSSLEANSLLLRMKDVVLMEGFKDHFNVLDMPHEFFYQQDEDGDTQLHISIIRGHSESVRWLIELAPEPWLFDIKNDDSHSALHVAVLCRRPKIVRRLVLAGANLELRTRSGNTALHLACLNGNLDCAKAILQPVSRLDDEILSGCNNNSMSSFLSSDSNEPHIDLELRNYIGKTCLHIAASRNDINLVNLLLQSGANPCSREGLSGATALHMAVQNDYREIARLLVQADRKSCLKTGDYSGCTAYQLAIELGRRDFAEELLLESKKIIGSRKTQQQYLKIDNREDLLSMHVATFAKMSLS
ncbi:hypothetical protein QAD02_004478 [Eretmocerus hayati]|uniref:Uncharacterized protein n=1 Tax=Eretmocerus hayati TaxID=131215 RepID=A0ACC2NQQ5_9HYME|nr:hypothetical protein QAD02_004478 [Eretmocerus hayati]